MNYDDSLPKSLKNTQQWFGAVISQPLGADSIILETAPSGCSIIEEAAHYIAPSPTLQSWQRIQLYNQQYWWRLLKILQDIYPMLTRLFGYHDFNKSIAVPYLVKYPSNHWSVDHVGDRLPKWITEDYDAEDKQLVLDTAQIELAFADCFMCADRKPIDLAQFPGESGLNSLLDRKIYLQPSVRLFELKYDLFRLRESLLQQEVDYWVENDFPVLGREQKQYHFVVYRDAEHNVIWNQLAEAQYHVLKRFQNGSTIGEVCEWLEEQDSRMCDQAAAHIHFWFQEWTLSSWLTLKQNP